MEQKKKNMLSCIGILCGIVILIFGIVMLSQDVASRSEYASFGGDFYTYSYSATRTAANNIADLCDLFTKGIGFLLLSIGLTDICLFAGKLDFTKPVTEISAEAVTEENVQEAEE